MEIIIMSSLPSVRGSKAVTMTAQEGKWGNLQKIQSQHARLLGFLFETILELLNIFPMTFMSAPLFLKMTNIPDYGGLILSEPWALLF